MGGGTTQFGVLSPRWGGTGVSLSLQTPIIALVGNDACWSQIAREQVAMLGSNVACGLEFVGEHCPRCPQRVGGGQLPSAGGSRWRCVTVGWDGPCLVAPCGLGWGRAGGTVWPWMGPCWWHRVALDGAVLVAPCGLGSGHAWWHRVALDGAMLVALHHRRLCHICCPRVPLYGTVVTLRTRPCWWHCVPLAQAVPGDIATLKGINLHPAAAHPLLRGHPIATHPRQPYIPPSTARVTKPPSLCPPPLVPPLQITMQQPKLWGAKASCWAGRTASSWMLCSAPRRMSAAGAAPSSSTPSSAKPISARAPSPCRGRPLCPPTAPPSVGHAGLSPALSSAPPTGHTEVPPRRPRAQSGAGDGGSGAASPPLAQRCPRAIKQHCVPTLCAHTVPLIWDAPPPTLSPPTPPPGDALGGGHPVNVAPTHTQPRRRVQLCVLYCW